MTLRIALVGGPMYDHIESVFAPGEVEIIAKADHPTLNRAVAAMLLAGEPIDVSGLCRNGHVVIEVADRGPGIPVEDQSRVFERFYRADSARATERGGSGLGLAIARWIVDLHGGEIRAETREPTGCRMVVELPA